MTDPVVSIDLLRSVRDGDVVWVTVRSGVEPEEMDVIRDVISAGIQGDATIIVTPQGFLENLHKVSLSEMVSVRDALEKAIDTYITLNAFAEA